MVHWLFLSGVGPGTAEAEVAQQRRASDCGRDSAVVRSTVQGFFKSGQEPCI